MKRHPLYFLAFVFVVFAPTTTVAQLESEKTIDWQPIEIGKEGFVVSFPLGTSEASQGEIFLGRNMSRVSKKITTFRYINGAVLILDYYEGDGKGIFDALANRHKEKPIKNEVVNEFNFAEYSQLVGKYWQKEQIYQYRSRVYVLSGYSRRADDPIIEDFFASTILKTKKAPVSPNLPLNSSGLSPRKIKETTAQTDDSVVYAEEDVDRKAIILVGPKVKNLSLLGITNLSDLNVTMRCILSASGKVSVVELSGGSSAVRDANKAAANTIIFIPAEKDGKLVSMYHSFGTLLGVKPGVSIGY